jgi:hypothetical protein
MQNKDGRLGRDGIDFFEGRQALLRELVLGEPAHDELLHSDFLSGVEYEGKTEVTYKVSRDFARRQKARELSGDPKEIFAIERLIRERIDGRVGQ